MFAAKTASPPAIQRSSLISRHSSLANQGRQPSAYEIPTIFDNDSSDESELMQEAQEQVPDSPDRPTHARIQGAFPSLFGIGPEAVTEEGEMSEAVCLLHGNAQIPEEEAAHLDYWEQHKGIHDPEHCFKVLFAMYMHEIPTTS